MRRTTFSSLVLSTALAVSVSAHAGEYNTILDIGDAMPEFSDLPATDGQLYNSDDFDADVVVLVSLANHCPWVRGMDQGLIDLVDAFEGQSVQVVGFSVNRRDDDRLPAMVEHGEKVGYNFTYVYDESRSSAAPWAQREPPSISSSMTTAS